MLRGLTFMLRWQESLQIHAPLRTMAFRKWPACPLLPTACSGHPVCKVRVIWYLILGNS